MCSKVSFNFSSYRLYFIFQGVHLNTIYNKRKTMKCEKAYIAFIHRWETQFKSALQQFNLWRADFYEKPTKYIYAHVNYMYEVIMAQVDVLHLWGWAVVTCAKLWPDRIIGIEILRFQLSAKKPFMECTVETLYSTIYYSKYFIELICDKSTQYVALWTHKRHSIPRPFGRAMECLLWVLQQKLTVL